MGAESICMHDICRVRSAICWGPTTTVNYCGTPVGPRADGGQVQDCSNESEY